MCLWTPSKQPFVSRPLNVVYRPAVAIPVGHEDSGIKAQQERKWSGVLEDLTVEALKRSQETFWLKQLHPHLVISGWLRPKVQTWWVHWGLSWIQIFLAPKTVCDYPKSKILHHHLPVGFRKVHRKKKEPLWTSKVSAARSSFPKPLVNSLTSKAFAAYVSDVQQVGSTNQFQNR